MKSLVTGGCGFIGSHIVDKLLKEGHEVIVLDNFSTGRKSNLDHQSNNSNLEIFNEDIRDKKAIEKYFVDVDYVYHIAALADIVPSIQKPEEYYSTNVLGTFNVVQCAKEANIKKLVYAASSSCYGIPDNYPTNEKSEIRPQYPYALTKYIGEETVMHWGQVYDLPVVSLRLFNVYGERSRTNSTYGAVFGVFLAQKLANVPYTVVGDGTQSRDFIYVTDVANAFYTACISDVKNEIMNVGNGKVEPINRIVEILGGEVTYIPKRPGEPDITFADTTKIKALLDWEPKVSFEQGIDKIVENIDYWRQAPVWTEKTIEVATKDWFKYLGDKDE